MREISHRTLSGFRVEYQQAWDELFAQVLAALRGEGMITLERMVQDGTKVKAAASPASLHREATLPQHLEVARERVRQRGDPRQDQPEQNARQRKAQERAAREKVERLEQRVKELQKVRAEAEAADPAECRASETEPEAWRRSSIRPSLSTMRNATSMFVRRGRSCRIGG